MFTSNNFFCVVEIFPYFLNVINGFKFELRYCFPLITIYVKLYLCL